MPLVEEELVTSKRVDKVGEVHVRKEIVTEEKQITVPVMREVVRVERVPVSHDVRAGDQVFEKASYDIPIREEHVTVEKHVVVREELHVGKEIQQRRGDRERDRAPRARRGGDDRRRPPRRGASGDARAGGEQPGGRDAPRGERPLSPVGERSGPCT